MASTGWTSRSLRPHARGDVLCPVTLTDAPDQSAETPSSLPEPAPVIVERSAPGIEVELVGGRRVRFDRDTDPEVVRRLVILLEGEGR